MDIVTPPAYPDPMSRNGRLSARPAPVSSPAAVGLQTLDLGPQPETLLYAPAAYRPDRPAPLVTLLHGAGGDARRGLELLQPLAEANGLLLLAPSSHDHTWDVILGNYGPDVALLDRALARVFHAYAVDPAHIAIGGFSDGASYALSLGLGNGDLFTHILAFSPGFMAPPVRLGEPRIFISHGVHDNVLPIQRCSRRLAPALRRAGYDVAYHEFDGAHAIPPATARAAVAWLLAADRTERARADGPAGT